MAYTRKFVILKKELGNVGETGLKGHSKLEMKGSRGTISVNIDNSEIQDFYNVDLITKGKNNKINNLGKIFIDGSGRGRGSYNLLQKEFKVEDQSGILITKEGQVFLGGYINKDDGSIENYLESTVPRFWEIEKPLEVEPEVPEEELAPEEELVEEFIPEEESVEELAPEEELVEEFILEEESVEELAPEEESVEEFIPEEESVEEFIPEEKLIVEELAPEEEPELEYYEEEIDEETEEDDAEPDYKVIEHMKQINQRDQSTNYILSILRFFPYTDPLKNKLEGYSWWIVDLDEENEYRSFLPYFSYLSGGNNKESYNHDLVTCNELMEKYKHYIFGLYNENEEVKYFIYGVPGRFDKEEHPNKGESGFNTWYEGETVEGYWIIYIDPMTGKEVYPFNPMVPTE